MEELRLGPVQQEARGQVVSLSRQEALRNCESRLYDRLLQPYPPPRSYFESLRTSFDPAQDELNAPPQRMVFGSGAGMR